MTETYPSVIFRLRNLISKAGIRLIEFRLKTLQGAELRYVRLGEVSLAYDPAIIKEEELAGVFGELGFEVIREPEDLIVEQIRIAAVELIHYANNVNSLIRNSDYISERLEMPYDKLSRIYSRKTGRTLEQYVISLKIEKAKELIANKEFTLGEIAYMLGYSSVQYLSNQFRKTTGATVSQFRETLKPARVPVEDI